MTRLLPASFTPSGLQSVVLVLEDRYSNYGAASCFVLAVEEGALTEQVRLGTWGGQRRRPRPGLPGDLVRLPPYQAGRPSGPAGTILYDNGNQPEWATCPWTQAGWDVDPKTAI